MTDVITWGGKKLEDCSKEELTSCVEQLWRELRAARSRLRLVAAAVDVEVGSGTERFTPGEG